MRVFDTQQFVEANFDGAEAAVESRTDKVDSDTRFVFGVTWIVILQEARQQKDSYCILG